MKIIACLVGVLLAVQLSAARDIGSKFSSLISSGQSVANQTKAKTVSIFDKMAEDMKQMEGSLKQVLSNFTDTQNICKITNSTVKCCAKDLFNNTLCLGVGVSKLNMSVQLTLSVNNRTIINETLSGKNPSPICGVVPQVPIVKFCVEPYDLAIVDNDSFHFCMALATRLMSKDIARVNLNCLRVKKDGEIIFEKPYTNSTSKAIVNLDTSKYSNHIDKSINPLKKVNSLFKKN